MTVEDWVPASLVSAKPDPEAAPEVLGIPGLQGT